MSYNSYFTEKVFSKDTDDIGVHETRLKNLRKNTSEIISLANGCFDLIHSGHIELLSQAKYISSIVVVALNSDDSIKRLKNHSSTQSFYERAKILAAMQFVDYVIPFDTEDQLRCIVKFLQPDYIVKGQEYVGKGDITGVKELSENNWPGTLLLVSMSEGYSSSDLKRRIYEKEGFRQRCKKIKQKVRSVPDWNEFVVGASLFPEFICRCEQPVRFKHVNGLISCSSCGKLITLP